MNIADRRSLFLLACTLIMLRNLACVERRVASRLDRKEALITYTSIGMTIAAVITLYREIPAIFVDTTEPDVPK